MLLDTVTMNSKKQCLMNGRRTMTANISLSCTLWFTGARRHCGSQKLVGGWESRVHDDIHPPPSAIKMTHHLVHVGMDSLVSHEDN